MKIIVIGLGSMGKRRIRLMQEMYPDYDIIGIDGRTDRREEANQLFGIKCIDSIDVITDLDCAFICTSPLSHNELVRKCLLKGWNVFTELNLVSDGYENNIDLAKKMKKILFLSSTFLYREEICYIQKKITNEKKWNYVYHIGQYLPDWHPWENYADFFLGKKRTNGCREILAIELPWITKTFGDIEKVNVLSDKMTGLNIHYDDNFLIQLNHKNGNKGSLVVDVVSPVAVRKLEVYSENAYILWNGTPESLFEYDGMSKKLQRIELHEQTEHMEGYREFVVENAYKNEIKEFFNVVSGNVCPQYGFEEDLNVLKLIDTIGA